MIKKKIVRRICKIIFLIINKIPCREGKVPFTNFLNCIKRFLLRKVFIKVGNHANIRPNIRFILGRNISIGNNSSIGYRCYLQDGAQITIGDDVMMGPEVKIYTTNHGTSKEKIMRLQPSVHRPVKIEDDVWIGHNVIILPNVTIGKGAVLGAGAIITKDVEEYAIVGGSPARVLKYRE
ncbi:acyltransferase [Clostridium beijerinckii]|uniref:acyltransferase n=1 Tax=Clostridium beijerinckii TaxID=1520 RepID=UPI0014949901|nr:DapH/DapD/GlmU-related protein [Clostridium beijerinckii]NOW02660.1 maltose O-acetyltransferase [Clostridium beijerinckii]NRT70224.1 maltose O-acetyltransferase [Clostridium beijerinckii]NYC04198.1 maltose O-acetyltransferase [Clostridium beijerinckii]